MSERDRMMDKRRARRLNSLAEFFLGNADEKSAASTQEIIGLGQRAAEQTESGTRKAIGNVRRGAAEADKAMDKLLSKDDPKRAERDMAAWIASIRGGLDPIDLPEMGGAPSLDYYQGQDIDSTEDSTQMQADRMKASTGAGYDDPSKIPTSASDYDYSGLPEYMQPDSAFRTALAAVEADSYDTMFGQAQSKDTPFKDTKVTQMRMGEIFDLVASGGKWHNYNKATHGENTTAIGKYQMVGATLRDLKENGHLRKMGIDDDTLFDQKTQDKIAMYLAERRVKPNYSMAEARAQLKNEWAGFRKLDKTQLDTIINEIRGSS